MTAINSFIFNCMKLSRHFLGMIFIFSLLTQGGAEQVPGGTALLQGQEGILAPENRVEISGDSTSINFKTDHSKASVYINEDFYGYTPLEIKNLIPGFYLVNIMREGFAPKEFSIEVKAGHSDDYYLELIPRMGSVKFEGLPENTKLYIDRNPVKGLEAELPAGKHIYTATSFGFISKSELFTVTEGEEKLLQVQLTEKAFSAEKLKVKVKQKNNTATFTASAKISKPCKARFVLRTETLDELYSSEDLSITEENFKLTVNLPAEQIPSGTKLEAVLYCNDGKITDQTSCELRKFFVK